MAKQLPLHMYWIVNGLYPQECWEETMQLFSIRQHNHITIKKKYTFNNTILAKKNKSWKAFTCNWVFGFIRTNISALIKTGKNKRMY